MLGLVGDFRTVSKRFWSFLKSLKFSHRSSPTLTCEGHTFQSNADKANCLNTCFSRKFSDPAVGCLPLTPELVTETLRRSVASLAFFVPNSSKQAFFESGWPLNFVFGIFLISGIFLAFYEA